jgi:hypothetical protein
MGPVWRDVEKLDKCLEQSLIAGNGFAVGQRASNDFSQSDQSFLPVRQRRVRIRASGVQQSIDIG